MISPTVSVIVLNYNGRHFLEACLRSLERTRYDNFRVIVVDNGSTDGSAEMLAGELSDFVTPVFNPANLGFSRAMNQILVRDDLCGEYVALLNNDTEVDEHWLDVLVRVAQADTKIGALQPKLLSLRERGRFDYAGAAGGLLDRLGHALCRGRIFYSTEQDSGQYDDVCEICWASGAAMLLRRDLASEVGLLDEDFWMHYEEIDLCWRLRLHGYKVMYVPSSVVYHYGGGAANPRVQYLNHRNSLLTLIKNYSRPNLLRDLPRRVFLDLANVGYALANRDVLWAKSIVLAYMWIFLHLPRLLRKRRFVQQQRRVSDEEIVRLMVRDSVVWQYFVRRRRVFSKLSGVPAVSR